MNTNNNDIKSFIKGVFRNNHDISEIIIQNQKPITGITHDNHYKVLHENNHFNFDDILDFSLEQNQIASKKSPSVGGIIHGMIRWHLITSPITVGLYCLQFRKVNFSHFTLDTLLTKNSHHYLKEQLPIKLSLIHISEPTRPY